MYELTHKLLKRYSWLKRAVITLGAKRTRDIIADIGPLLTSYNQLLDIGTGTGDVAVALIKQGFNVTACDRYNLICVPDLSLLLCDGAELPFRDNSFDAVLLIDVLHHTEKQVKILQEAARVAKVVIIHEDVFNSKIQRRMTFLMDRVMNLQFGYHPHSNRTVKGWSELFEVLGFEVLSCVTRGFGGFFRTATFLLMVG